jgi:hypothetical protein
MKTNNHKMKLIKFLKRLFWKYEKPPNPISDAISEGFKEAFKEMGYQD